MALNYIWIFFFLIAIVFAIVRFVGGDTEIFSQLISSLFDNAKTGFEISLWLTGVLSLWLGLLKIGENSGIVRLLGRALRPLFKRIFPEVPPDHPAMGSVVMNIAANMLGLDNAATPIGLKAMKELQEVNPQKDTASNAQILFLVLNTSGLTLIPINILVYRAQLGAANPTDVFIPILLSTFFSTMAGLIAVALIQKINLLNRVVLAYLGGATLMIAGIIYFFVNLPADQVQNISLLSANVILLSIIFIFIVTGFLKKVNVYESFIDGAKDGFKTAITIVPYLIAILVAIGLFRTSGAMNYIIDGIKWAFVNIGVNTDFVDALPTALMKPLSGSGARGMMIDAMKAFGADSFAGRLACVFQGSTDTTFYVLAVYFGSVGIKKTRHAVGAGLIADLFGILASIFIAYLFFH